MHVSQETTEQTYERLKRVIATAELEVYPGEYAFAEYPLNALPSQAIESSLALVRDSEVWSALQPAREDSAERFGLFSFHFKEGLDNSGFVGWLATHVKQSTGSGILVVCGFNHKRGGVFDYWGAPPQVYSQIMHEVRKLRGES